MKHKLRNVLASLSLALSLITIVNVNTAIVYAGVHVNMNGAQGAASNRCSNDYNVCWPRVSNASSITGYANDDGIRLSIFEVSEDGDAYSLVYSQDFSNQRHVGYGFIGYGNEDKKTNKIYYRELYNYSDVELNLGGYTGNQPTEGHLPWVALFSDGAANLSDLLRFFKDDGNIDYLLTTGHVGLSLEQIKSTYENGQGKYRILLEPLAYVDLKINNKYYPVCLTLTEMAIFDESYNMFKNTSTNIYYNTWPKAMFLSQNDDVFGFQSMTAPSGTVTVEQMKQKMGLAVISWDGEHTTPPTETPATTEEACQLTDTCSNGTATGVSTSATYRYKTNVISSLKVTNTTSRTKTNPLHVTYTLESSGATLCNSSFEAPAGVAQVTYCAWTTPKSRTPHNKDKIIVKVDGRQVGTIDITYQKITDKEPADTQADEKASDFHFRSIPSPVNVSSLNASESQANSWNMYYSENNHYDGTLTAKFGTTLSNLGSKVGVHSVQSGTRTWIPNWVDHGSYEGTGEDRHWVSNMVDEGHWTSWSYTYTDTLTTNEASEYYFYEYGSYGLLNETLASDTCSSASNEKGGPSSCKMEYDSVYKASQNKSLPYMNTYNARLQSMNASIKPDPNGDQNATATSMKSGYGIIADASTSYKVTCSGKSYAKKACTMYTDNIMTSLQNVVTTFPEFNYYDYQRVLDVTSGNFSFFGTGSKSTTYQFAKNKYDIGNERTHFTPIWYPDGRYEVKFRFMELWTPGVMLGGYDSSEITINGDLWKDWTVVKTHR